MNFVLTMLFTMTSFEAHAQLFHAPETKAKAEELSKNNGNKFSLTVTGRPSAFIKNDPNISSAGTGLGSGFQGAPEFQVPSVTGPDCVAGDVTYTQPNEAKYTVEVTVELGRLMIRRHAEVVKVKESLANPKLSQKTKGMIKKSKGHSCGNFFVSGTTIGGRLTDTEGYRLLDDDRTKVKSLIGKYTFDDTPEGRLRFQNMYSELVKKVDSQVESGIQINDYRGQNEVAKSLDNSGSAKTNFAVFYNYTSALQKDKTIDKRPPGAGILSIDLDKMPKN